MEITRTLVSEEYEKLIEAEARQAKCESALSEAQSEVHNASQRFQLVVQRNLEGKLGADELEKRSEGVKISFVTKNGIQHFYYQHKGSDKGARPSCNAPVNL